MSPLLNNTQNPYYRQIGETTQSSSIDSDDVVVQSITDIVKQSLTPIFNQTNATTLSSLQNSQDDNFLGDLEALFLTHIAYEEDNKIREQNKKKKSFKGTVALNSKTIDKAVGFTPGLPVPHTPGFYPQPLIIINMQNPHFYSSFPPNFTPISNQTSNMPAQHVLSHSPAPIAKQERIFKWNSQGDFTLNPTINMKIIFKSNQDVYTRSMNGSLKNNIYTLWRNNTHQIEVDFGTFNQYLEKLELELHTQNNHMNLPKDCIKQSTHSKNKILFEFDNSTKNKNFTSASISSTFPQKFELKLTAHLKFTNQSTTSVSRISEAFFIDSIDETTSKSIKKIEQAQPPKNNKRPANQEQGSNKRPKI